MPTVTGENVEARIFYIHILCVHGPIVMRWINKVKTIVVYCKVPKQSKDVIYSKTVQLPTHFLLDNN